MANPPIVAPRGARLNVPAVVTQVLGTLQQSQTLPPPSGMGRNLLAITQILGQDPGLRRPLLPGAPGNALVTAWVQAATAANLDRYAVLQGNGQVASVATALPIAPAVGITDGFGRPRAGIKVAFQVTVGGGNVVNAAATTGVDGVASPGAWTLGPAPGVHQLEAQVGGVSKALFVALAVATRRCETLGDNQQAYRGTALPVDPAVRILDVDSGQPVQGVNVAFAVTAGGGNVTNAAAVSNQDGIATPGQWTLGAAAGPNALQASAAGADTVVFSALAI